MVSLGLFGHFFFYFFGFCYPLQKRCRSGVLSANSHIGTDTFLAGWFYFMENAPQQIETVRKELCWKKKKRLPVAFLAAWYIWLRYFMTFLTEKYVSRIVNFHMNINTLYSINLAKLLCKSNSEQWINVFEKRNFVKNVMSYISECLFFKLKCRVLVLTKRNVRYVINFHVPTLTLLVSNSFHQCDEWLDKLNNMKNELCWRNWRLRSGCFVNWNCMFHLLDFGEEINSAGWFDWSNRSLWPALLWMLITVWLAVN